MFQLKITQFLRSFSALAWVKTAQANQQRIWLQPQTDPPSLTAQPITGTPTGKRTRVQCSTLHQHLSCHGGPTTADEHSNDREQLAKDPKYWLHALESSFSPNSALDNLGD